MIIYFIIERQLFLILLPHSQLNLCFRRTEIEGKIVIIINKSDIHCTTLQPLLLTFRKQVL